MASVEPGTFSTPVPARRLMIYLGESDSWRGRSLYKTILETLRQAGIAGATVSRALAGYGAHSRIRSDSIEVLSSDLPIVISVVDLPENIERALQLIGPMVSEGLITVEEVSIIKYAHRHLQPLPADLPVSQFMTRDVVTVSAETPVRQVVELLLGRLFKAVPVVDDRRHVIGIISDGDLLRQAGMPTRLAVGERLDAQELRAFLDSVSHVQTASAIMTRSVVTAGQDESLGHVTQRMLQRGLKRLPVVDSGGALVGMISRLDILRAASGAQPGAREKATSPRGGATIGEIMTPAVSTVHANDDLADVLDHMLRADIKHVVVLDEQGKPIGVITDSDLVARVSPAVRQGVLQSLIARVVGSDVRRGHAIARDLMSEHVLSAPPETSVADAIALMLRDGRKRLLVVDEAGFPLGLVDRQMLLAAVLG